MALGKTIREFGVQVSLLFDKSKVEESKKAIDGVADGMKEIAIQVASAATALLGIAGISSANSRTLEQNSKQLGINVGELQELEYAAKVAAGVSREELGGALEGLSKTLFDARNNTGEAAQTLYRLGVPLDLLKGKLVNGKRVYENSDKVLLSLAEQFKKMPDGIYKTALATQVFGGAGAKLIPFLNKGKEGIAAMGKEARSFGVILGDKTIKEGAEFDRQLSKIWIILKNITYVIGAQLIKYLGPMVNEFQKFIIENRKFIAIGIANVVKNLGTYLKIVFNIVKTLVLGFRSLVQVLGGFEKVSKGLAVAFGIFTGAKILGALGTMLTSFRAIGAVLGFVSLDVLAIGAAFAAIFFVVKDWFSDDSLIKKWLSKIKDSIPGLISEFQKEFPNLSKLVTGIFDIISVSVNDAIASFQALFGWISKIVEEITGFGSKIAEALNVKNIIKSAIGSIGDLIGKAIPSIETGAGNFGEFLSERAKSLNQPATQAIEASKNASSISPNSTINHANKSTTVNQGDTTMNATINVSVPRGTSAAEATNIVGGGVHKGFDAILRQTRDQFLGGVAQ